MATPDRRQGDPMLGVDSEDTMKKGLLQNDSIRAVLLVVMWILFSLCTEFLDKIILNTVSFPLTLTMWKFYMSMPCGFLVLYVFKLHPPQKRETKEVIKMVGPLGLLIVCAKFLTYLSYDLVPLSLTQTVKAATPLFSVVMTRYFLGETFSCVTYVSLVPIVLGVIIAMGTDIDFNIIGFLTAFISDIFMVGQSIAMKKLFVGEAYDTLTLNLHTAMVCSALLTPFWLFVNMTGSKLDGSQGCDFGAMYKAGMSFWMLMGVSAVSQYLQSVASYLVVKAVSPVTYMVVGTARKPLLVILAVIFFQKPITKVTALGISMAFCGVAWYNKIRFDENQKRKQKSKELHSIQLVASNK